MSRTSAATASRVTGSSAPKGSSSSRICGPRRQRAGQGHALALAAGKALRPAVAERAGIEPHQGQKLIDPGLDSAPRPSPANVGVTAMFSATVI